MAAGDGVSVNSSSRWERGAGKAAAVVFAVLVAVVILAQGIQAQIAVDQLAQPPANAQRFTILSTGGTHGKAAIWTAPDGSLMSRESVNLRGQIYEMDQSARLGADGMLTSLIVRGFTPTGDAAETFGKFSRRRAAFRV